MCLLALKQGTCFSASQESVKFAVNIWQMTHVCHMSGADTCSLFMSCTLPAAERLPAPQRLRLRALRLERLPPTKDAATLALWGYIDMDKHWDLAGALTRLQFTRGRHCCSHEGLSCLCEDMRHHW